MPGVIKYTVEKSRVPVPAGNPAIGYRVKITCTSFSGGPDAGVFCYKRVSDGAAMFSHVASYADMEDFALGAPVDASAPFFRLDTADLVFRDVDEREETVSLVISDLDILVAGVDTTSELSSISYGVAPAPTASNAVNGIIQGDGGDTYYILFPTPLSTPPQVFVSMSSEFGVRVLADASGFALTAARVLTPADTVSWHLG
jgi:hypothetical protein